MEDMTGLNPQEVQQQIINFYWKALGIGIGFQNDCNHYSDSLITAWCSPKAVEFQKKFDRIYVIGYNIDALASQIAQSAVSAYNIVARIQGLEPLNIEEMNFNATNPKRISRNLRDAYDHPNLENFKEVSDSGVVGMNVGLVKVARSLFEQKVKEMINKLNDLPLDISLYDPEGSQKEAYKKAIQTMIDDIEERVRDAHAFIEDAIQTEQDTIMLAKQQATDVLSA